MTLAKSADFFVLKEMKLHFHKHVINTLILNFPQTSGFSFLLRKKCPLTFLFSSKRPVDVLHFLTVTFAYLRLTCNSFLNTHVKYKIACTHHSLKVPEKATLAQDKILHPPSFCHGAKLGGLLPLPKWWEG